MKILFVLGIIVAWFLIGGIINYIAYSGLPPELMEKSQSVKGIHILLNIGTVIAIFAVLLS
jgi:hypothetical protein